MTIPKTIQEQNRANWFEPDHKYAFVFGMSTFDVVWKKNKKDEKYE